MIYSIKIGTRDNCYIITGGLEDISTFEPVEVDGTQNSVVIHIDSETDDIFTPFIKQSLEVQFFKYNDGDFDDIIAGNDNETFGILVEDGGLELVSGDLRITSGGKLKFIGTLTLETYTEQYKHISPISFIFHDRIGSLEDYDFSTNVQYKNVCDIIACCVFPVICSDKLFLEWPYTLSSSDDPQEFLLELSDMDEKTNKEVLETLLKDFGLQMVVDYSKNVQTNLKDSGAIVIRSVIEHAEMINTFWELNLTSFIASTCQRQYYTYTGDSTVTIQKTMQLCNSTAWPLLNNETTLELERVASSIVAKNKINLKDSLVFRSNPNMDYSYTVPGGRQGSIITRYCPYASTSGVSETILSNIKTILDNGNLSSEIFKPQIYNGELLVPCTNITYSPLFFMCLIATPLKLKYSLFSNGSCKLKLKVSGGVYAALSYAMTVFCNIIIKKNTTYYIYNGSSFIEFDNGSYVNDFNSSVLSSYGTFEKIYDFKLTSSGDDVDLIVCLTGNYSGTNYAFINNVEITPIVDSSESMPNSIELITNLSGNNRKNIELNPMYLNTPDVNGGMLWAKNIIMDNSLSPPLTVDYKGLAQTMLAHLSDQYGWQYDGNRWNMDATVKGYLSVIDLMGIFRLDDKNMMLLNGDYDARYREIKGTWGQVLEIEENKYRLLDDNFIPLTWDDGNIINLN